MHTAAVIGLICIILGMVLAVLVLLDVPMHAKVLPLAIFLIGLGVFLGAEPITAVVK